MRQVQVWLVALLLLGHFAPPASAEVSLSRVKVAGQGVATPQEATSFSIAGSVSPPGGIDPDKGLRVQFGDLDETVPGAAISRKPKALSWKADSTYTGWLRSFKVSLKTGKFRATGKKAFLGNLTMDPGPSFTVDIGGQRATGILSLAANGRRAQWRLGNPLTVWVNGRVFEVDYNLGTPVLRPVGSVTFVRNDSEETETRTDDSGYFRASFSVTDSLQPGTLAMEDVLGLGPGLTIPGWASATVLEKGEVDVAVLVQKESGVAGTATATDGLTLEVTGSTAAPEGSLFLPPGAIAGDPQAVDFTPYSIPAELPERLPDGYLPLAGAQIASPDSTAFTQGATATLELELPGWVDPASLDGQEIVLLQHSSTGWTRVPGKGTYDQATNRIVPDSGDPAHLAMFAPSAWALKATTSSRRAFRGTVRRADDTPVSRATVLTLSGAHTTGPDGRFDVPVSVVNDGDLDIVQVVESDAMAAVVAEGGEGEDLDVNLGQGTAGTWQAGYMKAFVHNPLGAPIEGARVTIGAAVGVTGIEHDDGATPEEYWDDEFRVPGLDVLNVIDYEWMLRMPGNNEDFVSTTYTGNEIVLSSLLLEAQSAGRTIELGAYTVRASYTVPGGKAFSVDGGFQVAYNPGVSEIFIRQVRVPPRFEQTASIFKTTGADGRFTLFFRAPIEIPLFAYATSPTGENSPTTLFQHTSIHTLVARTWTPLADLMAPSETAAQGPPS